MIERALRIYRDTAVSERVGRRGTVRVLFMRCAMRRPAKARVLVFAGRGCVFAGVVRTVAAGKVTVYVVEWG